MNKKITFLASGNGGTLKFLYYALQALKLPFEINMVIADRDCGAFHFAKNININSKIINYTKNNDDELINIFKSLDADIVITNIHKILTANVLRSTKADFINLHYSLLPAFAGLIGMKTVDEARKQNCQFIGATCHEVTEELDGGKILSQGLYPVDWSEDNEIIYDRVFKIACITFLNGILNKYKINYANFKTDIGIFNPVCCFNTDVFNEIFWEKVKEEL